MIGSSEPRGLDGRSPCAPAARRRNKHSPRRLQRRAAAAKPHEEHNQAIPPRPHTHRHAQTGSAPSVSDSALPIEIICALLTYSRDTARRDWMISLASTRHVPMSPRLAASVIDLRTFFSSNWMSAGKKCGGGCGGGMVWQARVMVCVVVRAARCI